MPDISPEQVIDAANEGRIRVVDAFANASDLVCKDVEGAYRAFVSALNKPFWFSWLGVNVSIEIDCLTETRQQVKVLMRTKDIRIVFKFPPPSIVQRVSPIVKPSLIQQ